MSGWSAALQKASEEVLQDVMRILEASELPKPEAAVLPIVEKYSRLVLMRDELPKGLLALQFHTTTAPGKKALAACLRILADARGVKLPEQG
jgi:hypothetical protein